ncbi:MAG: transglycosylase SLT domain-containing protein [Alistipes sp.]|nr:transglycosylase SLT domain-containing protein [Alistipes sp.]
MNRLLLLFWMIPMGCALSLRGQQSSDLPQDQLHIAETPAYYDSVIASWQQAKIATAYAEHLQEYLQLDTSRYLPAISTITDAVCRPRLKAIVSPIHLPYNEIIKKYLVAYTTTHKSITRRMLGYGKYYFPLIEQELARADLPLELKFVPVVESALNPIATSPGGAVGLWQFMLPTGRQYGLEISSMVDERRDPMLSTRAACHYLKELYAIYKDWTLALASYNYGPGNVNRAIQRAGANATTYWDIYPYLPTSTRDYIPALVALTYLYHYHADYGLVPFESPLPLVTDTVMVSRHLDLKRVEAATDVPLDLLRLLNPQYKQDIIPATVRNYPLVLPQQSIARFVAQELQLEQESEKQIVENEEKLALATSSSNSSSPSSSSSSSSSNSSQSGGRSGDDFQAPPAKTYRVKNGDTLGVIARKNGTTVANLMQWNNLKSTKLKIGQTLKLSR